MILEAFSLITAPSASWTEEEESEAREINFIISFGSCHCGPDLCGAWRRAILSGERGYKYDYALAAARESHPTN